MTLIERGGDDPRTGQGDPIAPVPKRCEREGDGKAAVPQDVVDDLVLALGHPGVRGGPRSDKRRGVVACP